MHIFSSHIVWLVMGAVWLQGCGNSEPIVADNLLGGDILVIGHGGSGFDTYRNTVPANTTASVKRALFAEGADGVEIDIQLSADGVPVLFHDGEMEVLTDCGGCVRSKTAEELKNCRYGTRHGSLDGDHRVATLREVFEIGMERKELPYYFLNVKIIHRCIQDDPDSYFNDFAVALAGLIREYGLEQRAFVETLDQDFLKTMRSLDSGIRLIFDDEDFDRGMQVVEAEDYDGLAISNNRVTREQVQEAHQKGRWLLIWGVRVLKGTRQAVEKSPELIMTDDIRMLRGVLGK